MPPSSLPANPTHGGTVASVTLAASLDDRTNSNFIATKMTIDNPTFKLKTNLNKRIYATLLDYGLYLLAFYVYVMFFGHDNSATAICCTT